VPHFFVDDGFSDSKEVLAIPARHRLAAVGLWTLCGSWSANKLTDGFIPDEALRRLGARPILINALTDIAGLWERVPGGIRFANWAKWQRTRDSVKAYRAAQAEKKRKQREAAQNGKNSTNTEMSPRDTPRDENPCPPGTPQTPIPIPEPNYVSTHHSANLAVGESLSPPIAAAAWAMIRRHISDSHPQANRTDLAIAANELLTAGTEPELVEAALQRWSTTPSKLGPKGLRLLVSDIIRERNPHSARANPNGHTHDDKVNDFLAYANPPQRPEIEA
jgi:hypothetical protein